ncbi:hypothetical protein L2E82_43375 [Cichorium intybus]|uniref:Uncharacterized protein n=1 Tax=Cichorium intybus TaxID=13427 RepID=A0ACB8ZN45_CICIN|nr:hypothetical protein L2E82_43375 [Cichorium intybus]
MDASRYKFCSIACKLGINTGKPTTKPQPVRPVPNKCPDPDSNVDTDIDTNSSGGLNRKRAFMGTSRRKGIPVKAPFF